MNDLRFSCRPKELASLAQLAELLKGDVSQTRAPQHIEHPLRGTPKSPSAAAHLIENAADYAIGSRVRHAPNNRHQTQVYKPIALLSTQCNGVFRARERAHGTSEPLI
jgi:hypothetical protein